jgi:hypothetical protein
VEERGVGGAAALAWAGRGGLLVYRLRKVDLIIHDLVLDIFLYDKTASHSLITGSRIGSQKIRKLSMGYMRPYFV